MSQIELTNHVTLRLRSRGDTEVLTGYLITSSKDIVLFAKYSDLQFAGVLAINPLAATVENLDHDNEFFFRVTSKLGRNIVFIPDEIRGIRNMQQALNWAMTNKSLIALEGFQEDEFEVASVVGVTDNSAILRLLGSDGMWVDAKNWIKISEVSNVALLDPYCSSLDQFFASFGSGAQNS